MKNERGFFTVVGLCLLLTAALLIQGVQEFEANYSRGVRNSELEFELQNAAESALLAATKDSSLTSMTFFSEIFKKTITVEIVSRKDAIHFRTDGNVTKEMDLTSKSGKIFMAVASCDVNFMEGKIYRRALAYVIDGEETVYFVNDS